MQEEVQRRENMLVEGNIVQEQNHNQAVPNPETWSQMGLPMQNSDAPIAPAIPADGPSYRGRPSLNTGRAQNAETDTYVALPVGETEVYGSLVMKRVSISCNQPDESVDAQSVEPASVEPASVEPFIVDESNNQPPAADD